jgi:predicted nucleic-acid-binding Zn-ribbon protein
MVCTLRQNRVRMPRGMHIKKTGCAPFEGCTGLSEGAQVSARGAHFSNITYDLRFLFLRAFLHIMCIRCYFTKFYYFLPFLAMSRGSHGVITSFLVFGTFSAMANECSILIFLAFWRTAPKNPK